MVTKKASLCPRRERKAANGNKEGIIVPEKRKKGYGW
jgi:hypothetical protein